MFWDKFPFTNFHEINLDWIISEIKRLQTWFNRFMKDIENELDKKINKDGTTETTAPIPFEKGVKTDKIDSLHDTHVHMVKPIDMDSNVITGVSNGMEDSDAVNKRQLDFVHDTLDNKKINKDGTTETTAPIPFAQGLNTDTINKLNETAVTITAPVNMSSQKIEQLANGVEPQDAVNYGQMTAADQELNDKLVQRITAEENARKQGDTALENKKINKDGSTTTTATIPFAEGIKTLSIGAISERTGIAIEADTHMNSHQLKDLADATDDQDAVTYKQFKASTPGSDPDAIKKDGTTVTTAPIPFEKGVKVNGNYGIDFYNNESPEEKLGIITATAQTITVGQITTDAPTDSIKINRDPLKSIELLTHSDGHVTAKHYDTEEPFMASQDADIITKKYADQNYKGGGGGSDPDAIKKDGTTVTTASIPFAQGIKTDSITSNTPDGKVTITSLVDMSAQKITNMADGVADTDAVTVKQLNTQVSKGDPNAIKKDGTTTTTAVIPFTKGLKTSLVYQYSSGSPLTLKTASGGRIIAVNADDTPFMATTDDGVVTKKYLDTRFPEYKGNNQFYLSNNGSGKMDGSTRNDTMPFKQLTILKGISRLNLIFTENPSTPLTFVTEKCYLVMLSALSPITTKVAIYTAGSVNSNFVQFNDIEVYANYITLQNGGSANAKLKFSAPNILIEDTTGGSPFVSNAEMYGNVIFKNVEVRTTINLYGTYSSTLDIDSKIKYGLKLRA